jgi:hypothetical protein
MPFHIISKYGLLLLLAILVCADGLIGQDVPFGTGEWDAAQFGNHRTVIEVSAKANAVWAYLLTSIDPHLATKQLFYRLQLRLRGHLDSPKSPAPFFPTSPTTWPASIEKVTPSTPRL